MAEKTLSERYSDLLERVDELERRVVQLEKWVVVPAIEHPAVDPGFTPERKRGNPNWVRKDG